MTTVPAEKATADNSAELARVQAAIRGFVIAKKARESKKANAPQSDGPLRSPFVPTAEAAVNNFLKFADVTDRDTVCDIGCGDGRIVIAAAVERKAKGIGIEIDETLAAKARNNAKTAGVEDRVQIRHCSIESEEAIALTREATVVFLFMLPTVMAFVQPFLLKHLPSGARVVTFTFRMAGWKPNAVEPYKNNLTSFYLYTMPPTLLEPEALSSATASTNGEHAQTATAGNSTIALANPPSSRATSVDSS